MGIGISSHVEGSGYRPFESASVGLDGLGNVTVRCGSSPHGQGHETTLAQVCAEVLDAPPDTILVRTGDTALLPYGGGTYGSRSAVTARNAVHAAAVKLGGRIFEVASVLLEVDSTRLVLVDGRVIDGTDPDRSASFLQVAKAGMPGSGMPVSAGIVETAYWEPPTVMFSPGAHVATVEVDPELASVRLLSYVVVDDAGTLLNPVIVDGQQHGGGARHRQRAARRSGVRRGWPICVRHIRGIHAADRNGNPGRDSVRKAHITVIK